MSFKPFDEYNIQFFEDTNGTFVALIEEIPHCHAWGRNREDSKYQLNLVYKNIIELMEE